MNVSKEAMRGFSFSLSLYLFLSIMIMDCICFLHGSQEVAGGATVAARGRLFGGGAPGTSRGNLLPLLLYLVLLLLLGFFLSFNLMGLKAAGQRTRGWKTLKTL